MAKRYRYAIIKKKEAKKGKTGNCFPASVWGGSWHCLCTRRQLRIYCRRNLSLCHAAVCIWIPDGNRKFFGRKL